MVAFSIVHSYPQEKGFDKFDLIKNFVSKPGCFNEGKISSRRQRFHKEWQFIERITPLKINMEPHLLKGLVQMIFLFELGDFYGNDRRSSNPGCRVVLLPNPEVFCSVRGTRFGENSSQPKKKSGTVGGMFFRSPFSWIFVGLRWCVLIL